MKLIKLDAIDSTNDFLKQLVKNQKVENFTVISAENQTNGKGQMGAKWISESGKNLTFSILIKHLHLDINQIYILNVVATLAIIDILKKYKIPNLSIKWPNDIMSDHKKIGGILIENSFKESGKIISIIGIGLNVNQINFIDLPKASSLSLIMKKIFDKEILLVAIINVLKEKIASVNTGESVALWKNYNNILFKKGLPMPFEKLDGSRFMGIITEVALNGKLLILLEDDSISSFEIKEIQMLY